jgi:glycosyltransferase involved in cell wall biosynthesis
MVVPQFPPGYGGAGLQAERLAGALGARGVRVSVLSTRAPDSAAAAFSRTPFGAVFRFRSPEALRSIDLRLGARAAVWLATNAFDVLHVHTVGYFAVAPIMVARARGRPYLLKTSLRGGDDLTHVRRGSLGRLLLQAYRGAAAVVALSGAIERDLRREGTLPGRIARIPNGVDTVRFRPAAGAERQRLRAARGIERERLVVLTAGQLGARKGVIELIHAVAAMAAPAPLLVLAGPPDPENEPALRRALAELPPGLEVRRPGHLPPDVLAEWMCAADVFALNSAAEGLPNALLEAAASGLACVATDIAGSREVLERNAGLLVPAGDRPALTRALDRLGSDAALRGRLGVRARDRAVAEFSLDRVADDYLALYRDLLAQGPRRRVLRTPRTAEPGD